MSVLGNTPLLMTPEGYQISRSVRLRSSASAYFSRTPAGAGNRQKFTISRWVKRGKLGATDPLFCAGTGTSTEDRFMFAGGDTLLFDGYSAGSTVFSLNSTAVYRDPSAWYHIMAAVDTTQATAANRIILYVNGVQVTSFGTATYPAQNASLNINNNIAHYIGTTPDPYYADSYTTEFNFVDGQQLTPSSFGETDSITGVWKPKKYGGTYGTNGFYLPFNNPTLSADITASATATAPSGGTANNAKASDATYLLTNTSTGVAFDIVKYDFGTPVQITKYFLGAAYFTGGSATWQLQTSNDDVNYTVAASIGVSASGANYSGTINVNARYVKLRATSFGVNGQAALDVLQMLQDGIAADASGSGNHWIPNNISLTAGATYDSMLDVPTPYADGGNGRGNYAVLNPLGKTTNATLSDANLKVTFSGSTGYDKAAASSVVLSSKTYWEVIDQTSAIASYGNCVFGIAALTTSLAQNFVTSSNMISFRDYDGAFYRAGTTNPAGSGAPFGGGATNDVYMFAYDPATTSLWAGRNGTWFNSGNPASGTGAISTTNIGDVVPFIAGYQSGDGPASINFGQRPFAYTPPTGFKALNTQNLPDSTIKKGNQYFDINLWTGTGASRSITNSGAMQPDLVWTKDRGVGTSFHGLFDSVRGNTKVLSSNSTNAESTVTDEVTSFNSDGFSLGASSNGYANYNGRSFVGWQWKKGATPGFDIVTYTEASGVNTIPHSLGVTPKMFITKRRDAAENWVVWFTGFAANEGIYLNLTNAKGASGSNWFSANSSNVQVTSGQFTSAGNKVAYLFAEVAGFSKFGSYTGNGSSDGPFVYCGFRPRFILVKRTDAAADWIIWDTARNTYNVMNDSLAANLSDAEKAGTTNVDLLSNGFKTRFASTNWNASGATYIFAAFAENPFRYALAR